MHRTRLLAAACLLSLAACGGGGSDSATPPSPAAGLYERAGSASPADEVLVLDNGRSYVFYGMNATTPIPVRGVAVMTLSVSGSAFSANDLRDFDLSAGVLRHGVASGSLSSGSSITGTANRSDATTLAFGGSYDPDSAKPASLSDLAGTYGGQMSNLAATQVMVVTIDASGLLAGSSGSCSWGGLALPHATGRVFDITINFGSGCVEAGTTLRGHAVVSHNVLFLAVVHDDAPRAVVFAGAKS